MNNKVRWMVAAVTVAALGWWVIAREPSQQDTASPEEIASLVPPGSEGQVGLTMMGQRIRSRMAGPPGQVSGRVVSNATGSGVPFIEVIFATRKVDVVVQTDSEGRFSADLPAGDYTTRAVGDRLLGAPPSLIRVRGSAEPQVIEIRVDQLSTVRGTVVSSDGKPLEGAVVECPTLPQQKALVDQGYLAGSAITDSSGAFELDVLPHPTLALQARSGNLVGGTELPDLAGGAEKSGVKIVIPAGARVRGSVVDPEGNTVANAEINVTVNDGKITQAQDTRTGPDGRFELPPILAGNAMVEAWAPGFGRSGPASVSLAQSSTSDVKLTLKPSRRLSGVVVNEKGDVLAGARVSIGRETTEWRTTSTTTDENGRFTMDGLDDAAYWVSGRFPGYAVGHQLAVRPPNDEVKVTVWRKGGIRAEVSAPDGTPVPDFTVTIKSFLAIDGSLREDGTVTRFSNGKAEMEELPPGTYTLVFGATGLLETPPLTAEVKPGEWRNLVMKFQASK